MRAALVKNSLITGIPLHMVYICKRNSSAVAWVSRRGELLNLAGLTLGSSRGGGLTPLTERIVSDGRMSSSADHEIGSAFLCAETALARGGAAGPGPSADSEGGSFARPGGLGGEPNRWPHR